MPVGIVKLFSRSRGYGFIRPDEGGGDVFVHRTALEEMGLKALSKGQRVVFDVREEHGKLVAKNLRVELDESLSQSETLIPQLQLVDVEIDPVTENLNSADRKLISRADLEQSLADAVREISPECGAFVGIIVDRILPETAGGINWTIRGVKYGKADRGKCDAALSMWLQKKRQEYTLIEE
jgi:CspA family cold shock protein